MSARQYLSLAMRLFADEAREEIFVMLLKMDGDPEVPYAVAERASARAVSQLGTARDRRVEGECLGDDRLLGQGRPFARLAEQEPQNAGLWQNVALCRAWDGDEIGPAEAFHRAAELSSDAPFAVECETLAQLCNLKTSTDGVALLKFIFRSAPPRGCWAFDSDEHLTRAPQPKQEEGDELSVAAEYIVRSKPLPTEAELGHLSPDDYPFVAATLTIFDANRAHGQEAAVYLRGYAGEAFDSALALVKHLAKDETRAYHVGNRRFERGRPPRAASLLPPLAASTADAGRNAELVDRRAMAPSDRRVLVQHAAGRFGWKKSRPGEGQSGRSRPADGCRLCPRCTRPAASRTARLRGVAATLESRRAGTDRSGNRHAQRTLARCSCTACRSPS